MKPWRSAKFLCNAIEFVAEGEKISDAISALVNGYSMNAADAYSTPQKAMKMGVQIREASDLGLTYCSTALTPPGPCVTEEVAW